MTNENQRQNNIPFDPGFAPYVLVFSTTYDYVQNEIKKFKNANQRKMKYKILEPALLKLADNITSFYLGCMLYGGYISNKFKNNPKEITGNDFLGLDTDECKNGDVIIELNSISKFIKNNDRNPFATRKINPKYEKIVDCYASFLELNEYFTTVKMTNDVKIPDEFRYINTLTDMEIDEIINTINDAISSKKIEKLLSSKYFAKI